jgi:hypothetical protein
MAIGTEHLDDGAVFVITINPAAEWDHSKFPHPLVTADYDADGKLFKIVAVGSMAKHLSTAVKDVIIKDLGKPAVDPEVVTDLDSALVAA